MRSIENWPVGKAAERLKRRRQERKRQLENRRALAQEWGRKVAISLGTSDPAVKLIIGFGSTYETWRHYRFDSDVDLAVVGGEWSSLMRRITDSDFDVSLIELELQNPEFVEYVRTYGEVLYERP